MARYFLRFRHSDTGLTPTYNFFKKASDLTVVTPPAIGEVGSGTYYFDYSPTFDIVFEVDGGPSIPTEEVRYIADTISPKDVFVDEPTSQVKDDVWNDTVDRAALTKGDYVEKLVGMETSLADIKGAGFATGTDSLKIISDNVDAINIETDATSIANAVWVAPTTGHVGAGTMGGLVNTGGSGGAAPSAAVIAGAVWDEATNLHTSFGTYGQALQELHSATCADGASGTIQLAVGASGLNDFYNGALVVLTSGTGVGQARTIVSYVGSTRQATVDRAWVTIPVGDDTVYMIVPQSDSPAAAAPSAATNAAAVWNETLAGHVTADSAGVAMKNSFKILKNRTKINTTLDTLTVYDDNGTSVLYVFNLKDAAGAPSGETPFERVP